MFLNRRVEEAVNIGGNMEIMRPNQLSFQAIRIITDSNPECIWEAVNQILISH